MKNLRSAFSPIRDGGRALQYNQRLTATPSTREFPRTRTPKRPAGLPHDLCSGDGAEALSCILPATRHHSGSAVAGWSDPDAGPANRWAVQKRLGTGTPVWRSNRAGHGLRFGIGVARAGSRCRRRTAVAASVKRRSPGPIGNGRVAPGADAANPARHFFQNRGLCANRQIYRPTPPSPARTNGAHISGWANSGGFLGSSIAISARRNASARPILGFSFSSAKAPVSGCVPDVRRSDRRPWLW